MSTLWVFPMPRTFKFHVQTHNTLTPTFIPALGKHICLGELRIAKGVQVVPLDEDLVLHVLDLPHAHRTLLPRVGARLAPLA